MVACNQSSPAKKKFAALGDVPDVGNAAAYTEVLKAAVSLSYEPLQKLNRGESLDQQELENVKQAGAYYIACSEFSPDKFATYCGAGQCLQALGEDADAIKEFDLAIQHAPTVGASKDEIDLLGSAYVMKSRSLILLKQFDAALADAKEASKVVPGPASDAAVAAALIQLKRIPEAKEFINKALKADPNQPQALQLRKLLG